MRRGRPQWQASRVRAELTLGAKPLAQASPWLEDQLRTWGLTAGLARLWLASAEGRFPLQETTEIHLEYDADLGLISCEVWAEGRRIFGIDDLV
jgi:hypothetical protein